MAKRNAPSLINWDKCIICQKNTSRKNLICPGRSRKNDSGKGYSTFVSNVESFNEINDPSSHFDLTTLDEGNGALQSLLKNNGKWHDSCRSKYKPIKIKRAQSNINVTGGAMPTCEEEEVTTVSIRSSNRAVALTKQESLNRNRSQCCFCKEGEAKSRLYTI